MKMAIDSPRNEKFLNKKKFFDILCDVQIMLGLVVICRQSHQV
jgi:hypothetical protein